MANHLSNAPQTDEAGRAPERLAGVAAEPNASVAGDVEPGADAAAAVADADKPGSAANVGRSAAMMSVLVIISRLTGFIRTWGQAFALGTTLLSSCYTVANNLPNQLYELVIGGMLITAFLPVYLDVRERKGRRGANEYVSNLLSVLLVILGVCFVLCLIFAAPLIWVQSAGTDQSQMADGVTLFRFFAIEVVLYCLSSVASGVLNAERDYFWSNAAPIFNNIITISSFVLFALLKNANPSLAFLALALGNPLGVLVQVIMQLPSLHRHGVHLRFKINLHDSALLDTVKLGAPTLIATLCTFVTVSVMTSMALVALPEQGSSVTYYARLWYTLPYAIFAVPITVAMFTEMSESFAKGDLRCYAKQLNSGMSQIMFVLIPFMLYLIVFSHPLMSLLRIGQFDAQSAWVTADYLASLALCLPFYGLSTFFQKTFSSMRRMLPFAITNVVASVVQVAFTIWAEPFLGIHAVSLGSLVYMIMLDVISIVQLRHEIEGVELAGFVKSCLRALGLGIAGAACGAFMSSLLGGAETSITMVNALVILLCGGVVAVAVTFGTAMLLRFPEVEFLTGMVRRLIAKRGR